MRRASGSLAVRCSDRAEASCRRSTRTAGSRSGPTEHGLDPITALHDPDLVAFLETAWDRWTAEGHTQPLYPDTLDAPIARDGMGPVGAGARSWPGWATGASKRSRRSSKGPTRRHEPRSTSGSPGADLLLGGEPIVYGLCRPPGHHVGPRVFGGSSYLNNAAIAVERLVEETGEPVAVLDLDYHHGNGTQQLFYERDDVLYVSLHGDPVRAWPYFSGHADETGAGVGEGATRNFPLPAGCADEAYSRRSRRRWT